MNTKIKYVICLQNCLLIKFLLFLWNSLFFSPKWLGLSISDSLKYFEILIKTSVGTLDMALCACVAPGQLGVSPGVGEGQALILTMAITLFQLFKVCICPATLFSFLKRLICRSGRGQELSGDQITLPSAVGYLSVPKQIGVEESTS